MHGYSALERPKALKHLMFLMHLCKSMYRRITQMEMRYHCTKMYFLNTCIKKKKAYSVFSGIFYLLLEIFNEHRMYFVILLIQKMWIFPIKTHKSLHTSEKPKVILISL